MWGALATAVEKMGEHGKLVEKLRKLEEERSRVTSDEQSVISEQGIAIIYTNHSRSCIASGIGLCGYIYLVGSLTTCQ